MDKYEQRRQAMLRLRKRLEPGAVGKIAEAIGKDASYISRMLSLPDKAGHKRITEDFADLLNVAFPGWLVAKEDFIQDIATAPHQPDPTGLPHPTDDEFAMVPQLDIAASCGHGCYVDHVVVKGGLAFKKSSLRDFGVPEHAARIIYAKGGSMWPTIKDGCVVLLNTADREPKEGRVFAICTPDGDLVLKRLVWEFHPAMGAQTWLMRSDNPDKTAHPDKILPPDDRTMIAGLAVWNDNRL